MTMSLSIGVSIERGAGHDSSLRLRGGPAIGRMERVLGSNPLVS